MSKYNPIHLTALELKSQLHLGKRTTNMIVKLLLKKIFTIPKTIYFWSVLEM